MRFIVPLNRTRVLSKESFIVSAREEEDRISSPMETVIWGYMIIRAVPRREQKREREGKGGDGHPSASSPWHLCLPGAGRFDFRVRRVRRRCIDLCIPDVHQPLTHSTNATPFQFNPLYLRRPLHPIPFFHFISSSSLPHAKQFLPIFPTYLEFGVAWLNPPLTCPIPLPPAPPIPLLLDPAWPYPPGDALAARLRSPV